MMVAHKAMLREHGANAWLFFTCDFCTRRSFVAANPHLHAAPLTAAVAHTSEQSRHDRDTIYDHAR
jgi:hypothetical protein